MPQRSGTCHACKKRKLSCDSKTPCCSQCLLTGRQCPGYQKRFIIHQFQAQSKDTLHANDRSLNAKPYIPSSRRRALLVPNRLSPGNRAVKFTRLETPFVIESYASTIVYNFTPDHELYLQGSDGIIHQSRLCGTWMRLVPDFAETSRRKNGVLYAATRALAAALSSADQNHRLICSARESYSDALNVMRNGLISLDPPSKVELLVTIMCLSMVEVLLGSSSHGFMVHVDGINQLMADLGPGKFMSGPIHHLFVAFQPIMVSSYIRRRKSNLLDQRDWNSVPFRIYPGNPLNDITTIVSSLPRLLEQLDILGSSSIPANSTMILALLNQFQQVIDNLSQWEQDFKANGDGSVYWPILRVQKDGDSLGDVSICPRECVSLWFANMLAANAMIHYWAFMVIALSNVDQIYTNTLNLRQFERIFSKRGSENFEVCVELCIKICQSVEFHLQDEMKIFGPTSAFFPLKISYDFFYSAGSEYRLEIAWCNRLLQRIIAKGCRIATFI